MRVEPLEPRHTIGARAHASQARYQFVLDKPEMFRGLWPDTYSALDGDVLAAISGAPLIDGMVAGWVLFTDRITPARFLVVHRMAVRFLAVMEKMNATRERLARSIESLGLFVWPSRANFVLARFSDGRARKVYEALRQQKVLVRHFGGKRLEDCLRISVGSDEEIDIFLEKLEAILAGQSD